MRSRLFPLTFFLALFAVLAAPVLAGSKPGSNGGTAPSSEDWTSTGTQGFGDRQNSEPWSSIWFRGNFYVGTVRSFTCIRTATIRLADGKTPYPPEDPDIHCPGETPQDLPLQAEIWRWTPAANVWERVYQSPNDVPIPGHPGKFVARDIGFRTMAVLREPDGSEALYVGGVSSNSFNPGVPPPRILRSADGSTFDALPQDRGTFLGDTDANGFRSMTVHKGRLYAVASEGLNGQGVVYEGIDPARGNDNWRQITPDDMVLYEMASFNGSLYLGSGSKVADINPFTVWKTNPGDALPYHFEEIIADSGDSMIPISNIVSMAVYRDRLYFGTGGQAEVYRINQDDSWDLIVGGPRKTLDKPPLSGQSAGFNWPYNKLIWRMECHDEQLYIGTFDQSTELRDTRLEPFLRANMGFDLFSSPDGEHFFAVTRVGFGDKFNVGVRTLTSTPYGLFAGAANQFYGLTMWRTTTGQPQRPFSPFKVYLPALNMRPSGSDWTPDCGNSDQ